eukprot:GEMP01058910.1.p1 GENE.GEMP01058910.1~~GEMP01058910.1.p1  ORF type:complete len:121 (-),score=1.00 GEMP01058910.1:872-1234(-)
MGEQIQAYVTLNKKLGIHTAHTYTLKIRSAASLKKLISFCLTPFSTWSVTSEKHTCFFPVKKFLAENKTRFFFLDVFFKFLSNNQQKTTDTPTTTKRKSASVELEVEEKYALRDYSCRVN